MMNAQGAATDSVSGPTPLGVGVRVGPVWVMARDMGMDRMIRIKPRPLTSHTTLRRT